MPNVEMAFAAMEGKGGYEDVMQTPSMPRRVSRLGLEIICAPSVIHAARIDIGISTFGANGDAQASGHRNLGQHGVERSLEQFRTSKRCTTIRTDDLTHTCFLLTVPGLDRRSKNAGINSGQIARGCGGTIIV